MTIYTDYKNWVIEFDKLNITETMNFDIGPIKKEDILATVKKIAGKYHAQISFHGTSCTIRKLYGSSYYASSKRIDYVDNFDSELLDIVERAEFNIESNARMRLKIKEYEKLLTKDQIEEVRLTCHSIYKDWRKNKEAGLTYGPIK